jgi:hypothetical protein
MPQVSSQGIETTLLALVYGEEWRVQPIVSRQVVIPDLIHAMAISLVHQDNNAPTVLCLKYLTPKASKSYLLVDDDGIKVT